MAWFGRGRGVEQRGGDPDGVVFSPPPRPWPGWPDEWNVPQWNMQVGLTRLIDVAWAAIDLNASVLASMPVYRLRAGQVLPALGWMINPDPDVYDGWFEFAKQVFFDLLCTGEAFVLAMARTAEGFPARMRVLPPWMVNVDLVSAGRRSYRLGSADITGDVCHIRYTSSTVDGRGHGPLEFCGARMVAAGTLQRYAHRLAETGGVPHYWIGIDRTLTSAQASDLLNQWTESRARHLGEPALLTGGSTLNQLTSMSARDMALLELSQFNEARIAVMLGVPPFLLGLPSGGDSLTYQTVENLLSYHDRSSLRPKAAMVCSALSGWALPRGQSVELNRDEYSRPMLGERAKAYAVLLESGVLSAQEVRAMERFNGGVGAVGALSGDTTAPTNGQRVEVT